MPVSWSPVGLADHFNMGTVTREDLFAWILLFGTVCFVYYPMPVSADSQRSVDYNQRGYNLDEEDTMDNFMPLKIRSHSPDLMTCNCSWGTVLYRSQRKLKSNKSRSNKKSKGRTLDPKEYYPMIAGLQTESGPCMVCAATIISEYHALTTAQCVQDYSRQTLKLAVGVLSRCRKSNDGGQYIPLLSTTYIHEDFIPASKENDIAIVVTQRKIAFNDRIGPTCIHTQQVCNEEDPILVLGWGTLSQEGSASSTLLKLFLEAVEPKLCKKKLGGNVIHNLHLKLCTTAYRMSDCAGDSGSPLFMVDHSENRIVQVAIMSTESKCGRNDVPATHVALHPYLGWIQWTVEKSLKENHPKDYARCDSSFCYITDPKVL